MKKIKAKFIPAALMTGILVLIATGCNKDEETGDTNSNPVQVPVLATTSVFDISEGQASYTGIVKKRSSRDYPLYFSHQNTTYQVVDVFPLS